MTTNYDRRIIGTNDAWLLDSNGKIVGVELAQAREQKTFLPGSGTDGTIAADVTGNLTGNVTGNVTGDSAGTHTGPVEATTLSPALAMVAAGAGVDASSTDMSATTGRVNGLSANLTNTGATVTTLKGADLRVSDAGGTANSLVGSQNVAAKSAGDSTGELWGTNSVASLTGGSVPNIYGVVGDLTVGAGATISNTDYGAVAAAGYFTSFIDATATITGAIDSAVVGNISGEATRGRSTKGTFGVTSILAGSAGVESTAGADAAFKVITLATAAGATFDYGLDLHYVDGAKSNRFGKADIRTHLSQEIYAGTQTTRNAVRTEVGTQGAVGSLYVSTAGKMYLKVATAGADTDWEKVTTSAAD